MSNKKLEVLKASIECDFNPNETMQVLRMNTLWLMSWGARNFQNFENKALFFNVSGRHHNGIVLITLAWDDTYTVRLLSTQWNEKAKFEMVYFDQLSELIDEKVERIKEYQR
jgi:hypothetical protein